MSLVRDHDRDRRELGCPLDIFTGPGIGGPVLVIGGADSWQRSALVAALARIIGRASGWRIVNCSG